MRTEIRICGFGGQGIILAGIILGKSASLFDNKEAVQTHTGCHGKGLIGQECHAEHTDGRSHTGCHEHTVPQSAAGIEIGQQIGVQSNDVGHGHKGGQTCNDLGTNGRLVLREFKDFFKHIGSSFHFSKL